MSANNKQTDNLAGNFELLRNVIRPVSSIAMKADLSKVDELINTKFEAAVKDNAPPDFHVLYADFKAEYKKFKDFILYDQLIGKSIVALGGGFSSGKSTFLNTLMGKSILPSDVDPSTSVPTYIVAGQQHDLSGINVFDAKFAISDVVMVRKIGHGFGKAGTDREDTQATKQEDVVTLGHIVESLFFATPLHRYEHLAFLDTPGYSKPESSHYSAKTDEQIARRQLNTANGILWFVQADAGTITEEDIKFIKTLNETIPKLILVSKSDKKTADELAAIVAKIKSTLDIKGVAYVDVLTCSANQPEAYDAVNINDCLQTWNVPAVKNNFAVNFKKLFVKCFAYYEEEMALEAKRLKSLNKVLTLSTDDDINDSLGVLVKAEKSCLSQLENIKARLKELQSEFFTEIKIVGDIVGIAMPEPSELALVTDQAQNPLDVLLAYLKKQDIKISQNYRDILADAFENATCVMNQQAGGSGYRDSLLSVLQGLDTAKPKFAWSKEAGGSDYQAELLSIMKTLNTVSGNKLNVH